MGKDLAHAFELASRRYAEASEILGLDLARVSFEGPEDELRQTRVTQPALYVHSCVLAELLAAEGVSCSAAAGHSLGEYSALFAARAFSFADGLRLVKARADAMQHAGKVNAGTMAAVVGLGDDVVCALCQEAAEYGTVVPANYNSPGQLVISGAVPAVHKVMETARAKGAKLVRELPVSGAFHSPLMRLAADDLRRALDAVAIRDPDLPVVSNVSGKAHTNADSVRELLAAQLLSPVRWTESVIELSIYGDVRWFEVGNGNVLAGLLKRTVKGAVCVTVGTVEDLRKVAETVPGLA